MNSMINKGDGVIAETHLHKKNYETFLWFKSPL